MNNLENVVKKFATQKCRNFGNELIMYIKSFWMTVDLSVWNMYAVQTRTNNPAEAYNNALGSKKLISRHPNPYPLG